MALRKSSYTMFKNGKPVAGTAFAINGMRISFAASCTDGFTNAGRP
jgi:hypothetical protein